MAAGRRTFVFAVFTLGIIVLFLLSKRLFQHNQVFTTARRKTAAGNLDSLRDIANLKNEESVLKNGDLPVGRQWPREIPVAGRGEKDSKSPEIFNTKSTYLQEVTKHQAKVFRYSKSTTVKTPPRKPERLPEVKITTGIPTKCSYSDTPREQEFNHERQKWQQVAKRTIMVFSAYLDSRKEVGGPVIRVLASGKQTRFGHSGKVSCVLWVRNDTTISSIPTQASYDVIYESRLHPSMYTAHFILCDLWSVHVSPESVLAVSVVPEYCGIRSNLLKLIQKKPYLSKNNTFGVCLSPLYGKYDSAPAMIEHFEMHRIFSVQTITVYVLSVGPKVQKVLEQYKAEGVVDIVNWDYPYSKVQCDYFAQREALNDCLYRNMGRSRFLAVVDLDEFITPRKTLTWDAMMSRMYKPHHGAYLFQHAYFLIPAHQPSAPTLLTQTVFGRPREVFPPGKIRCKTIYETESVVQVNIHFPYRLLPGVGEYLVPAEDGILHHYRKETMQIFHDGKRNFTYITDSYMVNYASRIRPAFSHRLTQMSIL